MPNRISAAKHNDLTPGSCVTVPLPAQQALIDQVQKGLLEIDAGGNSMGILLVGPSGTGKTTAIDLVSERYPPYVDGVQRCFPCCRISAASKGDKVSVA